MKKFIILFSLVAIFGFSHVSFADTRCGDPALSDANTTFTTCGGGSPSLITNEWSSAPIVSPGSIMTDESGIVISCPFWFSAGCYDLTKTTWYRNRMISLGSQLKSMGQSGGVFGYWINLAK